MLMAHGTSIHFDIATDLSTCPLHGTQRQFLELMLLHKGIDVGMPATLTAFIFHFSQLALVARTPDYPFSVTKDIIMDTVDCLNFVDCHYCNLEGLQNVLLPRPTEVQEKRSA